MITIGLAGWGDHELLYAQGTRAQDKLKQYSRYFKVVEVDSSYYAIHKPELFERWAETVDDDFGFIVKAYQGMTGQTNKLYSDDETAAMFQAFKASVAPLLAAGKCRAVLFQYPPWFDCNLANVRKLKLDKARMGDIPLALEFRHQSWFSGEMYEKSLAFMQQEGWIHSICDEPQVEPGSIPIVPVPTHAEHTVVRFHGRNASGWVSGGNANWREVRYLYHYNDTELLEWRDRLLALQKDSQHVSVIFNNNSGGDAAENARRLMELLGQPLEPLPPQQMDLFE